MYSTFSELLQKKGVTVYQVCKATGIASATMSDWKNGKSMPKQDKLKKIADYFGVTVDYLLTGKEAESKPAVSEEDIKLALFGGDGVVTDEMWREALFAVELIKQRQKERDKNANKPTGA